MTRRFGILLLDWTDIVIRVYEREDRGMWKVLFAHSRDVSREPHVLSSASTFITAIQEASKKGSALGVEHWEMYARYLPKQIIYEITQTIAFPVKKLTLQQEQELLCKGLLMNM